MTPNELLDNPALVALIGAMMAFVLCFAVIWCYIAIRTVRVLKILFHMEKLGYKRSPGGWWTRSRCVEVLRAADCMPTLGSSKLDATMQKLREQPDSLFYGCLIASLAFLFAAIAVLMAIVAERAIDRAIVLLMLLPAAIFFLVTYYAIKHTDRDWRSSVDVLDNKTIHQPKRAE